jgi:serine O-acetyltransferase
MMYRAGVVLAKIPYIGKIFRVVFEYIIRIIYSSDISLTSKIGPGLIIVHGHDIVIGGAVIIGERCKILNGVTLGNKNLELLVNQQPKIGNDVVIGSGAKLLGDINIGDNVVVGANSVVLRDAPSDVVVAGAPAKIVKKLDSGL